MNKQNNYQLELFPDFPREVADYRFFYEEEARSIGRLCVAGVDEAGRGPLAGPVVVAACHLPFGLCIEGVDDSKVLSSNTRSALFHTLTSHPEVRYAIEVVDVEIIDKINIFQATLLGMKQAVLKLEPKPDYVLVDGPHLPSIPIAGKAIIKGDRLSHSIACASILAKQTRDMIMLTHDKTWPEYGFAKHKGYGTQDHLKALYAYGPCPIHRRSFTPVKELSQGK